MVTLRGKYMKKIMSVIFLLLLVAMGMYAQTYYTGDGGRNITLAVLEPAGKNFAKEELWILPLVQGAFNTNFNRYSAINIVDRQNLDKILAQQRESASGNYSDADYINIGKLANARHILIGTITKTPNGSFMLEFSVSDAEAGKRVASYGPKPSAASALENLSAIQEASADLLDQLGVKLTDAGKRSLSSVANDQQIQAETALSKGIVAQKSGTAIEAFAYYLQAVNYNPSSAEIVSRLDIVNADITSSSMGEDIRNAIAWRKAWVGRLSECDQFVASYVKKTPLTTTLVYSADFKQGEIDWGKETIPISVDVCLAPSESWPVPITGVVNAVYEGFAGTGQATTWKLDWPLKNVSGGASQVTPSTEVKYNLVLDLLNDKGVVLGRQGVTFTAGWKIEFRDGKSVGVKTQTAQTVTYPAVDANKISETLVIRVASINGRIVNATTGDSVTVKAITGEDFNTTIAGIKIGAVVPQGNDLAQQLAWISNQAGNGTVYDIIVNNNIVMKPTTVSTRGQNITINIRSANSTNPRIIELTGQGHLFDVDTNITLILQDIILKGHNSNNSALIRIVSGGKLILNSGSKIIGNTNISNTASGGGIRVNGGVLELNEGCEISGNMVRGGDSPNPHRDGLWGAWDALGGGIYAENRSTVTIRGGLITENKCDSKGGVRGGGIFILSGSTVNMTGGIISKNTCTVGYSGHRQGGGVWIQDSASTFTKKAAPGSNTSGIIYGSSSANANTATDGGQAIFRYFANPNQRNATLGVNDEISTSSNSGWGQ